MKNPNAWLGCRRDTKDMRDHMFAPRAVRLPPAVDLRPHCPSVMDQGDLGSCTANAITGALRYEMKRQGSRDAKLSRLQLYYDERAMEGTILSDAALGSKLTLLAGEPTCLLCYYPSMETGRRPRWTKDDTLHSVGVGTFFVGSGIIWGAVSGTGVVTGALVGAALSGVVALFVFGYMALAGR